MKRTVTLTEVVVASVILALVFGGLFASFIAVRNYVNRANKRLIVINLVRRTFNSLYPAVREDWWNDENMPLYAGPACLNPDGEWCVYNLPDYSIDNINYENNDYRVKNIPGKDYREVKVTIHYPQD